MAGDRLSLWYYFLSDSMSMFRKIENLDGFEDNGSLKRSKLKKIGSIFVTNREGLRENESSDRRAGKATMNSGRSMDQSDILHAIREDS
jgi:hypothetical protein